MPEFQLPFDKTTAHNRNVSREYILMTGTRKLKKLIFTFSISLNTSHAIQSQAHSR